MQKIHYCSKIKSEVILIKKIIDFINKKENLISVICIFIIFFAIILFIFIYGKSIENNKFKFEDHLEENVLSIYNASNKDEIVNINLRELAYYIIIVEANVQSEALQFKPDAPYNYWSLKPEPFKDMRMYAKDSCIEACIRDNILYIDAKDKDFSLTEAEYEEMQEISYDIYKNITAQQLDVTHIQYEDICKAQEKIFLAEKYALSLIDSAVVDDKEQLLADGDYYINEIKTNYTVDKNNSILNELVFGTITVNIEQQ